jgi:hypothetical protein
MQQAIGGGYRVIEGSCDASQLVGISATHTPDMRAIMAARIVEGIEVKPIPHERDKPAEKGGKR